MNWLWIVGGVIFVVIFVMPMVLRLLCEAEDRRIQRIADQEEREAELAKKAEREKYLSIVKGVIERFDFVKHWHVDRSADFNKLIEQCEISIGDAKGTKAFDLAKVLKIVRQAFGVPYESFSARWYDVNLAVLLNEVHGCLFGLDKSYDPSDPDKWIRKALAKDDSSFILLPSKKAFKGVGEYHADVQPEGWVEVDDSDIWAAWYQIPQYIRYEYVQTWCFELLKRVAIFNARMALWQELEVAGVNLPDEEFRKYQTFCRNCWRFYVDEDEYFADPIELQKEIRDRHQAWSAAIGDKWTGWHWMIFPNAPDPRITETYWASVKKEWFSLNERAKQDKAGGRKDAKPLPEPEGTEYVSYF